MQSEMDLHVIDGLRKRIKGLEEENTELAIKWGECGEQKNRYREALEKIAADSIVGPGYTRRWITLDDAQTIASEALKDA